MSVINEHASPAQSRGIRWTVTAILVFMLVAVAGFVYRMQQPRVMSEAELKVNGLYLLQTPRNFGEINLTHHTGHPIPRDRVEGRWSLVLFGFTYCPDICPPTMAFLNEFVARLEAGEVADTQVVLVSVDPARDTVDQMATYVPYFNPDFIGVTGEFLDIHRFATALNTPFRRVPGQDDDSYVVDHSANVVLINPRGDYHGFFKAPLDLEKMTVTYRSARAAWDKAH